MYFTSSLFAILMSCVLLNRLKKKPGKGKRRKRKDCEKKKNSGKRCWQRLERLKRPGGWRKKPEGKRRRKRAGRYFDIADPSSIQDS